MAFVDSLVSGNTVKQAATDAGIADSIAVRWIEDTLIRSLVRSRQKQVLQTAMARVVASSPVAIAEMGRLMRESKDENIRLRAAQTLSDKAERLSQEHPAFREESASNEPMFVLPPGTRVVQMMTTAVIPRQDPTLKRVPAPMVVVDDPGDALPPSPALPLPSLPPEAPPLMDDTDSPEPSNLLEFKPDGSR
jgi:hypothetical protein